MKRGIVAIFCAAFWALPASAQTTPEARATAKELFQEARAAMEAKDYVSACPKFEESQRLDPGGGTLLNLAVCHELVGRTASAWTEFSEALRIAKAEDRADRQELAAAHLAVLEPKLSRLSVDVPETSRVPGIAVRRDGVTLGPAAWNQPVPIDPGEHVVEASAPGKNTWSTKVVVRAEAERATVSVPVLEDQPMAPEPTPPVAPQIASPLAQEDRGRPLRISGLVVGGAGVVSLGVGAVLGLMAIDNNDRAREQCIPGACSSRADTLAERAGSLADASTVLVIVGATALVAGAVLYFIAPSRPAPSLSASW